MEPVGYIGTSVLSLVEEYANGLKAAIHLAYHFLVFDDSLRLNRGFQAALHLLVLLDEPFHIGISVGRSYGFP